MIKRLLLGLLLALVLIPASAQDSWAAWVYTPSDGSVVRVSAQGDLIDTYHLPIGPAFNAYGPAAVASANGRFIAYTTADTLTGNGNAQLVVYDTQVDVIRFTYDISGADTDGLSFEKYPHTSAFDENAQTFAFGLLRDGAWELVVANLANESISGGAPLTADNSGLEAGNLLPVPEIVRGNAVRFFLLPIGTNYFREYAAYLWTPGQAVSEVGTSSAFSGVLASSGEIAVPVYDESLPAAGDIDGPALAYNAVELAANGRERLLNDDSVDIMSVRWIDGGNQVLIRGFDPEISANVLKVYNRNGELVGQLAGDLDDIHGTPDGFAGLFPSGGGVGLAHVATDGDFAPVTIWTTGDPSVRLILVQG